MRIAIIGSRGFNDYPLLCKTMKALGKPVTEVVSGGAPGADTEGERYADENGLPKNYLFGEMERYRSVWSGYKRR